MTTCAWSPDVRLRLREMAWRSVRSVRRRVPLYFDETARISRAYATAALDLTFAPGTPNLTRRRAAERFARTYRLLGARQQFAFRWANAGPDLRAELRASSDASVQALIYLARAMADSPNTDALKTLDAVTLSPTRLLFLTQDKLPKALGPLAAPGTTYVFDTRFGQTLDSVARLKIHFPDEDIQALPDIGDLMRANDPSLRAASDAASVRADDLARTILHALPEAGWQAEPSPALQDILALHLSDVFFRGLELCAYLPHVLDSMPQDTLLISGAPELDLALQQLGQARGVSVCRIDAGTHFAAHQLQLYSQSIRIDVNAMNQARDIRLAHVSRRLRSQLDLPKAPNTVAKIILSTSTRMGSYRKAAETIVEGIDRFDVRPLDFSPANLPGAEKAAAPDHNLSACLSQRVLPGDAVVSDTLLKATATAMARANDALALQAVLPILVERIEMEATYVLGLECLYRAAGKVFADDGNDICGVIGLPDRVPGTHALIAAAREAGLPTFNLQNLLTNQLGRYRPPVAEHSLLIDHHVANAHADAYGLTDNNLHVVGSLMADMEMRGLRTRAQMAKPVGVGILYATQPLHRDRLAPWLARLTAYVATRPNARVRVRPHPAQSLRDRAWMAAQVTGVAAISMSDNDPLGMELDACHVLLTHYSNVGLIAAASGLPALALDAADHSLEIDLEQWGAARRVSNRKALFERLDEVANAAKRNTVPDWVAQVHTRFDTRYGDGQTLSRIEQVLLDLCDPKS